MAESDLHSTWIRLRTGKEFSRMLYPNPVCFLSTWKVSASSPATASSSAHHDNAVVTAVGSDNTRSGEYSQLQHAGNAMVLSWLTPTNNSGRFMFSINKSRYSASLLAPSITDITTSAQRYRAGVEFTLSVPTRGMEQKIIDTGSISGRFGSKFALERGAENPSSPETPLFFIDGTVAHLKCRTYGTIGSPMSEGDQTDSDVKLHTDDETEQPIIDHDHLLVMAEVVDAHVHPLYWDDKKLLFRPVTEDVPPYLTFLGSQTFGYVKI